jgi:hypothetical protein
MALGLGVRPDLEDRPTGVPERQGDRSGGPPRLCGVAEGGPEAIGRERLAEEEVAGLREPRPMHDPPTADGLGIGAGEAVFGVVGGPGDIVPLVVIGNLDIGREQLLGAIVNAGDGR